MDHNRRSAVSSYYGRPRSSADALSSEHPATYNPYQDYGGARDSSSTYHEGAGPMGNAGYNRASYHDVGRREPVKGSDEEADLGMPPPPDEAFDVFADFNNAGTRYSSAFGKPSGYQPIAHPAPAPSSTLADSKSDKEYVNGIMDADGNVEMVTVPGLGPEWSKAEMRGMTAAHRREQRNESRARAWHRWNRGESGLCGINFLTRRTVVFILFGICIIIAIVVAFTLPRVPSFSLNSSNPLQNATAPFNTTIPIVFNHAPTNFSFPAIADLEINTAGNFLPLRMSSLKAEVFDSETDFLVGTGLLTGQTYKAGDFSHVSIPMNFSYSAVNDSDVTWNNWHDSCKNHNQDVGGQRPGLSFRLLLTMDISGLIGKHQTSTSVTSAPCPVELGPTAS